MKRIALLIAITATASAWADSPEPARRIIETSDAIFFESGRSDLPNTVWVFPKMRTTFRLFGPSAPDYWQASVELNNVTLSTPSELYPGWEGKTFVFFAITPTSECTLNVRPEMQSIQQWSKAKSRTIQGADKNPVCSFTFKLSNTSSSYIDALQLEATNGTLIREELSVSLSIASRIVWSDIYNAYVTRGNMPGSVTSSALASFQLGLLDTLEPIHNLPTKDQTDFLSAALNALFISSENSMELKSKDGPPEGVYLFPGQTAVFPL